MWTLQILVSSSATSLCVMFVKVFYMLNMLKNLSALLPVMTQLSLHKAIERNILSGCIGLFSKRLDWVPPQWVAVNRQYMPVCSATILLESCRLYLYMRTICRCRLGRSSKLPTNVGVQRPAARVM